MVELSISIYDLEYFLLILTRVSCFVFVAPFFSMSGIPKRVRVAFSFFTAMLLYQALSPAEVVIYDTVLQYAFVVMKEAIVGLIIGLSANICTSIVNFSGSIVDMETGLAMVNLMDPTSKQMSSISGVLYQYVLMLMMIASGMYRYLFGAMADTFTLIPINGAIFRADSMLQSIITFLGDYVIIGFRIVLPIFCVILLLNAILGVLAKVAPQLNMFSVGIQLKILVGLSVLFFSASMLPGVADFVFSEMKQMITSFVNSMMPYE
uniref:flagellar biosynthetic protein FliR n=1 Tax=Acetatifactor sp. TaxID=1872090 RepID=UPI00405639BD